MASDGLFDLTGKVALVTGGNGGLGLGMALGLAGAGADVAIAGRNREKTSGAVEQLSSIGEGRVLGLETDVALEPSIRDMVSATVVAFGRVDILVNNAGIAVRKQPQDLSAEEWDNVQDVNLRAVFLVSREAYPHIKSAGGGKIINVGSMFSLFGSDWVAPYSASKGGVVQLTKSLAVAWAGDNIQVNAILPGWFQTELTAANTSAGSRPVPAYQLQDTQRTLGRATGAGGNGRVPCRRGFRLRHGSGHRHRRWLCGLLMRRPPASTGTTIPSLVASIDFDIGLIYNRSIAHRVCSVARSYGTCRP